MKKSASIIAVVAALGIGFGSGYMARGPVAAPDLIASAPAPAAVSRSIPSETAAPTPKPRATAAPRPQSTPSTYIINKNSRVFHLPDCSSVDRMKESNKVTRKNVLREELMEEGYQRCTMCLP